ncbi:MAG: hypothetical protein IPM16_04720 [Chloroflexi bacterium]|nr:hypothetical protein [Chloroflexota bacterium]
MRVELALLLVIITIFADIDIGWNLIQLQAIRKGLVSGSIGVVGPCLRAPYLAIYRWLRVKGYEKSQPWKVLGTLTIVGLSRAVLIAMLIYWHLDPRSNTSTLDNVVLVGSLLSLAFFLGAGWMRACSSDKLKLQT